MVPDVSGQRCFRFVGRETETFFVVAVPELEGCLSAADVVSRSTVRAIYASLIDDFVLAALSWYRTRCPVKMCTVAAALTSCTSVLEGGGGARYYTLF